MPLVALSIALIGQILANRMRSSSQCPITPLAFAAALTAFAAIPCPTIRAADAFPARTLDPALYHLGTSGFPEWEHFAGKTPHGRRLDLRFNSVSNANEQTLLLRQQDVKFTWQVQLNGRKIGELTTHEPDQVTVIPIPPGGIRDGENTLAIVPPNAVDDIVVGEAVLVSRPVRECLAQCTLDVTVREGGADSAIPCRITVADSRGALVPLRPSTSSLDTNSAAGIAVRTGVVYSRDGHAMIGLMPGNYIVHASRGFEYGVATGIVSLAAGQTRATRLEIHREVPTPGLVACDTHIHTLTYSGHGDATLDERMLTIAGEGIELAVATDHNHHTDYAGAALRQRVRDRFTPVIGNEVTTSIGHFNAFPIERGAPIPDFKSTDWPSLMSSMRATPGVRVITLNHPRDLHSNFTPLGPANFNPVSGQDRRGTDFTFDGLEVITSGAMQSDIFLLYRDWFALLNRGYRIAALASSDTHDVNRFIVGQGRTYVVCDDRKVDAIDIEELCRNVRAGRALVSLGLLTQIQVDDRFSVGELATNLGPAVNIVVTVSGPSWTSADRVELFANGIPIRQENVTPSAAVEKARINWRIPKPQHDVHLVAIATGPGRIGPYWEIPRPYQPSSKTLQPRVIGSTNPVWLDADGDGRFSAAREYALRAVRTAGNNAARLVAGLAPFDESVSAQAACLWHESGNDLRSDSLAAALNAASPSVRSGFAAFSGTLK
jgi:hypothetical protein